jgi:hypothetical protein
MSEQPSYTAPPGHRWGTGSATVLAFLLRDLAQKPHSTTPPAHAPAPQPVGA